MATILKRGSKGAAVKTLQTMLNQVGTSLPVKVDGDFGGETETSVEGFQRFHGLVVDGKVGQQTKTALEQANKGPVKAKPEPDKSAMGKPVPTAVKDDAKGKAPPNVATLVLRDTARPIVEVDWHCAATPEGKDFTVADIRSWHKQRGFSDIGYHYVVYRDGRIMEGRPIGQVGAHIEGHNTGSIGCCYIGGISKDGKTPKDTRTPQQIASMLWLTKQLIDKFDVKQVKGHNDYTNAKACPSFRVGNDPLGKLAA